MVFSELPDQFSAVAIDAAANNKILHNGEICIYQLGSKKFEIIRDLTAFSS